MGFLPDNHIYSYSQLSQVAECPYGFYLQRIDKLDQKGNAFASQGTLIHDLLDQWAKGLIKREDLTKEYIRRYPLEVVEAWPKVLFARNPKYAEKAYQLGVTYFDNFDEFAGYRIIDTERRFKTDIEGRPFVGIIDMILEDENTGELIVCDHKSKSLDAFKKTEDAMYIQQLLYSKHIYECSGQWPDRLMFNLFKENGLKMERPFDKKQYDKAIVWAVEQIEKIENFTFDDWLKTHKEEAGFFCTELCSMRDECPSGHYKRKKKEPTASTKKKKVR